MTDPLLSSLRYRLGVSRLSELRDSVSKRKALIGALPAAYSQWADGYAGPSPHRPGALRPVVARLSGLNPFDDAATAAQMLLTCESVAVQIPDTVSYLQWVVRLLVLLEEEIDQELIILLPDSGYVGRSDNFERWFELERTRSLESPNTKAEVERRVVTYFAAAELAIILDLCAAYPDRLDLVCRNADQSRVLKGMLQSTPASIPDAMMRSHDALHYMPDLLSLSLPCFDLSVHDLVQLRKEGLFNAWQEAVRQGLASLSSLDDDQLLDPQSARRAELREYMGAAAADLANQVSRSSVLHTAEIGAMRLAVSCAAGVLAAAVAGPVAGGAIGAGSFMATSLLDWLGGRPSSGTRAFRRLAVDLFSDLPT